MVLTSLFVILAIGVLAYAVITQPFYGEHPQGQETEKENQQSDCLLRLRQQQFWLQDLEVAFASGRVEEADYQRQRGQISSEIIACQSELATLAAESPAEGQGEIESMISTRRQQRAERSAGFCVKCGAPLQMSDQYCPKCGLKLK
jgi:hypothetical protein